MTDSSGGAVMTTRKPPVPTRRNGGIPNLEHKFWDFAGRLVGEGDIHRQPNGGSTAESASGGGMQSRDERGSAGAEGTDAAPSVAGVSTGAQEREATDVMVMREVEESYEEVCEVRKEETFDEQPTTTDVDGGKELPETVSAETKSVPEPDPGSRQRNGPDTVKKQGSFMWEEAREKRETEVSEVEMLKERFAKLLLGEDMSGGAKGVCQALAISNAITNLSASVFGEHNKLAPIGPERRTMWRRELEWLLCVADYIVELVPAWQTSPAGIPQEVMVTKQRADLHASLPALRKLDNMSLEALESFKENEFWYEKPGSGIWGEESTPGRHQDKWWLPTPRVPAGGLSEDARRHLQQQRDIAAQVLKAAMAINAQTLAEMDIPDAYCDTLPKSVRACLGEGLYRVLTAENCSPDVLLAHGDLSSEHAALEMANKLESAIYSWRRKIASRNTPLRDPNSRHMGEVMRDMRGEITRAEEYADRAEAALLLLRQRCPGLPQTALDGYKIQYNRDVGKSILESYSRVLESLASNVVSRIEDVLYADDLARGVNRQVSTSPSASQRFSLDIPTVASLSTASTEEGTSEVWESSPLHSPSPSQTPTSPLSVKSDSSFRERMWRRKPPGLPPGASSPSMRRGIADYIGSAKKSGLPSGKSTLWRSLSETSADKHGEKR